MAKSGVGKNQPVAERETWGSHKEFILSCVGYTVGLGNVVRFPYLAYSNGGGAFLVPYLIILLTCGMPMYFMEVSLGQYIAEGPIQTWRIVCPLFRGIGMAMLLASFFVALYYNVLVAWVLYYLFTSFRADVPWRNCDPAWASAKCWTGSRPKIYGNGTIYNSTTEVTSCKENLVPDVYKVINNVTNATLLMKCKLNETFQNLTFPSEDYFSNHVLDHTKGIEDTGHLRWQLFLCLIMAWIVVYFCMWKGIKSAGKVVYFTATFPYFVLLILLVRGVTLDNAVDGIKFYLTPDFNKLFSTDVWAAAGSQLFYSLGPAFGSLISFGSYNKFNNNCVRDAIFISFVDFFSSTLAGLVIFSVLGFMAGRLNVNIDEVATAGPGLAFMIYPEGIAQMPLSPLWSVLFFFMLFTLGLDSMFGMMECVVTNLVDEYPQYFRKHKELFVLSVCGAAFLGGILMVTQGGIYWYTLFDYQSAGTGLIFVALMEVVVVGWIFGADRFLDMSEEMLGYRPSLWWKYSIKIVSPIVLSALLVFKVFKWSGISYGSYSYPNWAECIGWLLALSSAGAVPLLACVTLWKRKENTFLERLRFALQPDLGKLSEKSAMNSVPKDDVTLQNLTQNEAASPV